MSIVIHTPFLLAATNVHVHVHEQQTNKSTVHCTLYAVLILKIGLYLIMYCCICILQMQGRKIGRIKYKTLQSFMQCKFLVK